MKKMDIGVGVLVLLGFLTILGGVILQLKDINLLEPVVNSPSGYFLTANTCFILALVLEKFGKE